MSRLRHTLGLLLLEERAPGKALQRLNRVSLAGVGRAVWPPRWSASSTPGPGRSSSPRPGTPHRCGSSRDRPSSSPCRRGRRLGVQHCDYKDHEFHLDRACLVMFTDGLVERRGSHLDERFALLESSLRASPSNEPEPGGGLRHRRHDGGRAALRRHRRPHRPAAVGRARASSEPPDTAAGRDFRSVTACTRRKPLRRSSAPTCPFPASTASSAPTATSTAPPRRPRCSRWPTGSTNSCPGTPASHRGAGYKSRRATAAYEGARDSVHRFAGRPAGGGDVVVLVRNTTEAINHLAYRLGLGPDDVVATTVVEHHANLLPWARVATRRWVECGTAGTFDTADVVRVLDDGRRPALLALTGASNVTGWLPPVEEICAEAHAAGVPVLLDAAQLAPHRPLPPGPDFVAFSGHKLYAPFGAGALIGPREVFEVGDPFLAGGGAVDLVDLDEVIWTDPPEREEAGSPNVVGAVAFGTAMDELERIGWDTIAAHEARAGDAPVRRAARHRRCARPRTVVRARRARRSGRGDLHPGRDAPRPGGGPVERGVRDRRAARVLLRASLPDPPARRRPRGRRPGAGGRAARRPQRAFRARSGPAAASGPPATTSTPCSTRCDPWRTACRRPCPTCRTTSPATSGPMATLPDGASRTGRPVPRARGGERTRASPLARGPRADCAGPRAGGVLHACGRHVSPRGRLGHHGRLGDVARHGRDPGRPVTPLTSGPRCRSEAGPRPWPLHRAGRRCSS